MHRRLPIRFLGLHRPEFVQRYEKHDYNVFVAQRPSTVFILTPAPQSPDCS
jgi:hypothetical protein